MYDAVNGNDRERVCHDDDDKREIRVEWVKTPPKDFFFTVIAFVRILCLLPKQYALYIYCKMQPY